MLIFCFPIIICSILLLSYQKRNNWIFGPISLLYLTYTGMNAIAIIGFILKLEIPVLPLSFSAILYFSVVLFILLSSVYSYRDKNISCIEIENIKLYNILKFLALISSIGAIIFFSPFAIKSLQGDISANRNLQINISQLSSFGIVNTFFSLVANCFIYCQIIGILEISQGTKKKKLVGYALILSSLSYYFYILSYVGRDGYVYWTMSSIFTYFLLRKFLHKQDRILLIIIFLILVIILLIPFMKITYSRFGTDTNIQMQQSDNEVANSKNIKISYESEATSRHPIFGKSTKIYRIIASLINYSGQQISNFNDLYIIGPPPRRGGENFSKFLQLFEKVGLDFKPIYNRSDIDEYYFKKGTVPWVFSTIIGSFISDFGKIGAVIAILIIVLINFNLVNNIERNKRISVSWLIIFTLFYQMIYWGVFYFRLYSANLYIAFVIFISLIFRFFSKNSKGSRIVISENKL